jgi:hypothetical protein
MSAKERILGGHLPHGPHLCIRGSKVPVPEKRHLFDQRIGRTKHSVRPPGAQVRDLARIHRHAVKRGIPRDKVGGFRLVTEKPLDRRFGSIVERSPNVIV